MDDQILIFLTKCNIHIEKESTLDGLLIPREILLSDERYDEVKEYIPDLKKKFSSCTLTSLHKNASSSQKWPLLNLVRQILKLHDYKMTPIRKAGGYTKDRKKIYKRYFLIDKIKQIKNTKSLDYEGICDN